MRASPPEDTALSWLETPEGLETEEAACRLLRSLFSHWPRRGHTLLHVGCEASRITDFLWEAGFDVTGVTPAPGRLEEARSALGKKADLRLGRPDHLPCDDNSFDFVVLPFLASSGGLPADQVEEAVRVAASGVLIGFFNAWAWPGRTAKRKNDGFCRISPLEAWRLLRKTGGAPLRQRLVFRSAFHLPRRLVRSLSFLAPAALAPAFNPLGDYALLRADFAAWPQATPLGLRVSLAGARSPAPWLLSKR